MKYLDSVNALDKYPVKVYFLFSYTWSGTKMFLPISKQGKPFKSSSYVHICQILPWLNDDWVYWTISVIRYTLSRTKLVSQNSCLEGSSQFSAILLGSHESTVYYKRATVYYSFSSCIANQYVSKQSYLSECRVNLRVQHNQYEGS